MISGENEELLKILEELTARTEEQQALMDELYQELLTRENQIQKLNDQISELKRSNAELQKSLTSIPDMKELLLILEKQKAQEAETQRWKTFAVSMNRENAMLQRQNEELLQLISPVPGRDKIEAKTDNLF